MLSKRDYYRDDDEVSMIITKQREIEKGSKL
jgi:hypothetical protein